MTSSILRYVVIFVCFFTLAQVKAQETNAPKFGKGLFNLVGKDSTFSMKVGLRFQSLATSQWDADNGLTNPETSMFIRRSRLKFDGFAFSPKLKYKLELGLSNRDQSGASQYTSNAPRYILDAVLKWNFSGNFVLWFGQTKLPGNRERVISSQKLQMVDRSMVNSIFNIDREMGVQLRGKFNAGSVIIKPMASFSFGEGRNITASNIGGFHYVGRVEVLPFGGFSSKGDYFGADLKREKAPKLALAASYSLNDGATRQKHTGRFLMNEDEEYLQHDLQTIFADMMFKYQGFSLMGEYAHKIVSDKEVRDDADLRLSILDADGRSYYTGSGFNLQAGYLFKKNLEVSARYTSIMPDTEVSFAGTKEYTLGLSKYIVGHSLKLQSDVSFFNPEEIGASNELRYRLQMEFQF